MSYDSYRTWMRGLKDSDLNKEIAKLRKNANDQKLSGRAREAWGRMFEMAVHEQVRRDNDHSHLLRGLDA